MVHPSQQKSPYPRREPPLGITFSFRGRTRAVAIRPWVAGSVLGTLALVATGIVSAAAYLLFHDDLLGTAISRQVEMQYAYEERIAALRSELDRMTSRHIVQTEGVEQQLATLLERQSVLERRQVALDALVEKARASGMEVASVPRLPRARPDAAAKGKQPAAGTVAPLGYMPSETAGTTQTDAIVEVLMRGGPSGGPHPSLTAVLRQVQSSLDDGQARQTQALDALSVTVEDEVERLSSALSPIGVQLEDADAGSGAAAPQGGPFVPAARLHFVERTAMLDRMLDDVGTLRRSAASLPLKAPLATQRVSSRFGYRIDPIEKKRAFHSGLDLVAPEGTEVHATAPGTVIRAGWHGGYGIMVEIRHASGVSSATATCRRRW